jgi:hypothetical protein
MPTDQYIHRRNELNRRARAFLHDLLTGGPQTYQAIRQHAREAGVSLSPLMRAMGSLNVESRTRNGYAVWQLPAAV